MHVNQCRPMSIKLHLLRCSLVLTHSSYMQFSFHGENDIPFVWICGKYSQIGKFEHIQNLRIFWRSLIVEFRFSFNFYGDHWLWRFFSYYIFFPFKFNPNILKINKRKKKRRVHSISHLDVYTTQCGVLMLMFQKSNNRLLMSHWKSTVFSLV